MAEDTLRIDAPKKCSNCKTKMKKMHKKNGVGWLAIPARPGIMLFGCPICHTVHMNTNAVANTQVLIALVQRKVKPVTNIVGLDGKALH